MQSPAPTFLRKTVSSCLLAVLLLGGCEQTSLSFLGGQPKPQTTAQRPAAQAAPAPRPEPDIVTPPATPVASEPLPPPATAPAEVKAALLVPLSGPSANVGGHLFNAAQLALFEYSDGNFTLLPFDTRGSPEGAVQAAERAIAAGVDIILGPLFSADVKAAAPIARQAGVSMVAFTTDRNAAGSGVFVLGFLPRTQVARVVRFAREEGLRRFALLAFETEYGRTVAEAFHQLVPASGGQVTAAVLYDPRSTDLGAVVQRLSVEAAPMATSMGDPGFDALLIADEGARLRGLAALLPFHGIDPDRVRLLGTMLWDDPTLGTEPALVGGWYPALPKTAHEIFVAAYSQAFGSRPPAIASLAYDAIALAAVLARQPGGDLAPATLTSPNGFARADSIFRLLPDGTSQRGLAVMEVTREGPVQVSPAPDTFEQAVY